MDCLLPPWYGLSFYQGIDFAELTRLEKALGQEVLSTGRPHFLFWELQPVITAGYGIRPQEVDQELTDQGRGLFVVRAPRGGRLTVHGPGQLGCFPLIPLGPFGLKLHDVLTLLEDTLMLWLRLQGLRTFRRPGLTGVWWHSRQKNELGKVAAIGIGARKGLVQHGFSLNIESMAKYFSAIVPCGNRRDEVVSVTEMQTERGSKQVYDFATVARELAYLLARALA
jgi:lipoate-protein ligase B